MDITIRKGRPDDADFIAWVIQEAGRSHLQRGIWDLALPGSDEKRLGYISQLVKIEDRTFCHYGKFLISEVDAVPAAALTAYIPMPDIKVREITIKALNDILTCDGWTEKQIGTMMQCFAPLQTCTPEAPDNTWIIDFVATRKEFRGRGLVGTLLDAILVKGRNLGCKTSQVAIFIGNTSAQRAYEKAGFKIVDEKRHPDFEAALECPGISLLRCVL